jgi:hypothetical protein
LTPGLTPQSVTPQINVNGAAGIPSLSTILANVLGGGNLNNLLSTADKSGQITGGQLTPEQQAQLTLANAYSQNLAAKNAAMNSLQNAQGALNDQYTHLSQYSNDPSSIIKANNALLMGQANLPLYAKVAQGAALSPTYAPQLNQSMSSPAGTQWSPWGNQQSGWVSPVQSPYIADPRATGGVARSIMSAGV